MHANCVKADPWLHGYEWELNALLCVCAAHARACLSCENKGKTKKFAEKGNHVSCRSAFRLQVAGRGSISTVLSRSCTYGLRMVGGKQITVSTVVQLGCQVLGDSSHFCFFWAFVLESGINHWQTQNKAVRTAYWWNQCSSLQFFTAVIFINEIFNKNKSKKNLIENFRIGFEILDSEIILE